MRKRWFSLLLSAVLLVSILGGCNTSGDKESEGTTKATQSETEKGTDAESTEVSKGITFPLEKEMTFDIIVKYDGDIDAMVEKCTWLDILYEQTNVKINFIALSSQNYAGTLNAMYAANQEPDAIVSSWLSESELMSMVASDFLMPLEEYMTDPELMPNFNERLVEPSPEALKFMRAPDGHVYSLGNKRGISGQSIESPMFINNTWLKALNMSVEDIKTMEDLENVLIAFRDNDMDGDGSKTNEIPYLALDSHSQSHLEAMMGHWGIGTKANTSDNYVYVKDGDVLFAPATEAWKEAVITLNRWWEEGLIWSECFTGTTESFNTVTKAETPIVGLITARSLTSAMAKDFVLLEPVEVEGYDSSWFIHPGYIGVKGYFSVSKSCENPEVLMAWADLWYSFENTVIAQNGTEEDGRWFTNSDGKVELKNLSSDEKTALDEKSSCVGYFGFSNLSDFTREDWEERIVMSDQQRAYCDTYDAYEPYLNKESWPRPYLFADVNAEVALLQTDLLNTVKLQKAKWITGEADITADWDKYVKSLETMQLDRFIDLLQKAYDNYIAE